MSCAGPLSKIPVVMQSVVVEQGQVAESIINLSTEQLLRYLAVNIITVSTDEVEKAMDTRVSGPEPSNVNPELSQKDTGRVAQH